MKMDNKNNHLKNINQAFYIIKFWIIKSGLLNWYYNLKWFFFNKGKVNIYSLKI